MGVTSSEERLKKMLVQGMIDKSWDVKLISFVFKKVRGLQVRSLS